MGKQPQRGFVFKKIANDQMHSQQMNHLIIVSVQIYREHGIPLEASSTISSNLNSTETHLKLTRKMPHRVIAQSLQPIYSQEKAYLSKQTPWRGATLT